MRKPRPNCTQVASSLLLFLLLVARSGLSATAPAELDPTFDASGIVGGTVRTIAIQEDGKIIAGGQMTLAFGGNILTNVGIVRLMSDGSIDSTFIPPETIPPVLDVVVQPDAKL